MRTFLTLLMLVVVPACSAEHLPSYRYRLTVTVATPEGVRRGSSVLEVRTTSVTGAGVVPQARGYRTDVSGEAVVVDLGRRGLLVALLRAPLNENWAGDVMRSALPPVASKADEDLRKLELRAVLASAGPLPVPSRAGPPGNTYDNLPVMVRVTGGSITDVAPTVRDHLDASFGAGVRLIGVTAERTSDKVTQSIDQRLPWLARPADEVAAAFWTNPVTRPLGLNTLAFERHR